jgi:hypothetical protein
MSKRKTSCDPSKLLAGLRRASATTQQRALDALDVFGEHVMGDSQAIAPHFTGFMANSGTTEPARRQGNKFIKRLKYGANYSLFVHEDLEAHHENGQAKFLETAMRENQPKMAPFIASKIGGGNG